MLQIYYKQICELLSCQIRYNGYIISEKFENESVFVLNIDSLAFSIEIHYDSIYDSIRIITSNLKNTHYVISDYYTQPPFADNVFTFKTMLFINNINFILTFIFEKILVDIKYINSLKLLDDTNDNLRSGFVYKFQNLESYIRSEKLKLLDEL